MCDTMVALGDATADGTVILAKNSDRQPNEAQQIVVIPPAVHEEGEKVKCTYIEIPQVRGTYGVLPSKPFWIWGCEMGANECGVAIARGLAGGEHRVRITAWGEGAALDGFIVRRRVSYQVKRIVWGSAIVGALLVMGYVLRRR